MCAVVVEDGDWNMNYKDMTEDPVTPAVPDGQVERRLAAMGHGELVEGDSYWELAQDTFALIASLKEERDALKEMVERYELCNVERLAFGDALCCIENQVGVSCPGIDAWPSAYDKGRADGWREGANAVSALATKALVASIERARAALEGEGG